MTARTHARSWSLAALCAILAALPGVADAPVAGAGRGRSPGPSMRAHRSHGRNRTACEGDRPPVAGTLLYELRAGAFPGSGRPDVAVHVPPGFDATRSPGAVVYFHGWNGCVEAALSDDDLPCSDGGDPRPAGALATQIDDARINALLIAVELRADMSTGEPGQVASSGGMRALLRELLDEHLAEPLGCAIGVDELERIVVIAHSGGYQAAAGTLAFGDLPQITEVDLLDAYYGADEVFRSWALEAVDRFDGSRRFVDLYTCCGGTVDRARALAGLLASEDGAGTTLHDDDGDDDLDEASLAFPVVLKRVPRDHMDLPRAYVRSLVEAAGFARIDEPESYAPDTQARRR
jgi:hypothetical protein